MDIQLGERIKKIVSIVKPCNRVIDIGCDHGLMSMALAERKDVLHVLATDISSLSLEKLIESKKELPKNVQDKITVKVSDGFLNIDEKEIDVVLIAGMGGERIINILSQKPEIVNNAKQLVLSPHSRTDSVRKYLYENNLIIVSEELVYEDFYYEIIEAVPKNNFNKNSLNKNNFNENNLNKNDLDKINSNVNNLNKVNSNEKNSKHKPARVPENQLEWEYGTYLLDKYDKLQIDRLEFDLNKNENILKILAEAEESEKIAERKKRLIEENEWRREWIEKMKK